MFLSYGASNNVEMAKTSLRTHTWLSRAYLALARLSCIISHIMQMIWCQQSAFIIIAVLVNTLKYIFHS